MAFCKNCGAELKDGATFCTSCGAQQGKAAAAAAPAAQPVQQQQYVQQPVQQPVQQQYAAAPQDTSKGNAGWAVLGFFFPLIGLILYLVWRDTHPGDAKMAGKGALISVIAAAAIGLMSAMASVCLGASIIGALAMTPMFI